MSELKTQTFKVTLSYPEWALAFNQGRVVEESDIMVALHNGLPVRLYKIDVLAGPVSNNEDADEDE